jgi:hypothetical protein
LEEPAASFKVYSFVLKTKDAKQFPQKLWCLFANTHDVPFHISEDYDLDVKTRQSSRILICVSMVDANVRKKSVVECPALQSCI